MPIPATPAPEGAATTAPPPRPSPDLAAYLHDLPLPVCVFSHADLSSTSLQPPILVSPSLEALLAPAAARLSVRSDEAQGGHGSAPAVSATLLDVLDDEARAALRDWLVEGADLALAASSSSPSSSSASKDGLPASDVLPVAPPRRPSLPHSASSSRHIALQVDPFVSLSKLHWRAAVSPGFTILTLLPSSEAIVHDGTIEAVITRLAPSLSPDAWQDQVHPDDYDRVHTAWEKASATGDALAIQFRWKHGTTALLQIAPNHFDKSRMTGWIGSVTDTTAQVRLEKAILDFAKERETEAKVRAEEAEASRKAAVEEQRQQEVLIDVTSHEIRNPISAILQNASFARLSLEAVRADFLDLKAHDALPAVLDAKIDELGEVIEALDAIMDCGMAQERIANDILGLAQIQLSKYTIKPVLFDLAQSLRTMIHMFRNECRTKGIDLRLVVDPSVSLLGPQAHVVADPARLTQVLVNLLTNAIRFTAQADTRIVTLSADVRPRVPGESEPPTPPNEDDPPRAALPPGSPIFLCFSVADTGLGMTEEETKRVFAKFTQASPETQTKWGGSGLGLWIARNLCRLQGGRIKVQSSPGKGSTFRCFISARSADAAAADAEVGLGKDNEALHHVVEGIASLAAPSMSEGARAEKKPRLKGLKVLCCEDNAINRQVLRKQLDKEGCSTILMACDGQEGVDLLRQQPGGKVDCVLMDIEMPILDGLAATRLIRHDELAAEAHGQSPTSPSPSRHQRIVGLTGNARDAQLQAGLDAGMDALVTKPYTVPDLVDHILGSHAPSPPPLSSAPSSSSVVKLAVEAS